MQDRLPADSFRACEVCQQYYSISKVAEMLDVSEKTVRRSIVEGMIKAKRVRGLVRIPHVELVKLIRDY